MSGGSIDQRPLDSMSTITRWLEGVKAGWEGASGRKLIHLEKVLDCAFPLPEGEGG
jgi:hypothetical protein